MNITDDEIKKIDQATLELNSAGYDAWGLNPETLKSVFPLAKWIYRNYFRVEVSGVENVPRGKALLIGNHSGQLPIDGMLIMIALLLDNDPPRIVRGMVERWFPALPFVSTFFTRCGQVVGDIRNCRNLLERNQTVMVFPEGVVGIGKTIFERYKLQKFGTGFARIAMEAKAPIVPVAVIGCEESLPSLSKLMPLAKLLRTPYVPLLPLGPVPLPTKVTIRFGKPIAADMDPDAPDSEIKKKVEEVKSAIETELRIGLEKRGDKLFTGAGV